MGTEDRLAELRKQCGYSEDSEDYATDALIDYKNALEDEVRRLSGWRRIRWGASR